MCWYVYVYQHSTKALNMAQPIRVLCYGVYFCVFADDGIQLAYSWIIFKHLQNQSIPGYKSALLFEYYIRQCESLWKYITDGISSRQQVLQDCNRILTWTKQNKTPTLDTLLINFSLKAKDRVGKAGVLEWEHVVCCK